MIKLQNYTPEIYYKQSRDFQFIGRLYDIILNSVKTNSDVIYDIPKSNAADSKLIDLLALTLGFSPRHRYNIRQLAAVCSILPRILKTKGTQSAIEMACQAVLTAEGIKDKIKLEPAIIAGISSNTSYNLFIPQQLSDISLIKDLLDYILPAGITVEIKRAQFQNAGDVNTELQYTGNVILYSPKHDLEQSVLFPNENNTAIESDREKDKPGFITNSTIINLFNEEEE